MTDRNLVQLQRRQAERLGPRPALRHRRHGLWHDVTWEQYLENTRACAAALAARGIAPGDRVGLVSENRKEWLVADMGILAAGAVNVPPHAPLTATQIQFQLADAGVRWVFLSSGDALQKLRHIRANLPALEGVVVFDGAAAAEDAMSWEAFLQEGRHALAGGTVDLAAREAALGPDSLATVMYTSGTTGNPKGVMLTHGNLLSNTLAVISVFPLHPDDVKLAWLPFSHIYARTVDHYLNLASGIVLCLAQSAEKVADDLKEVEPTHFSSVPRFYEKLLATLASDDPARTRRRLREAFGSRIRWLGSGGAPLPVAVAEAYRDHGLLVLQGYGLTESSPVISFNRQEHYKIETVGQALPGVEVAIAPDGEVLTRGPHVMQGYWNNPEATAEALRDGWLHTGDLGRLDDEGFLSITGRKKDLLVLSSGKKVVPTWIEGLLLADPCIDQAVVYGEGRNFLSALIVPHWENVRAALRDEAVVLDHETEEQLVLHSAVQGLVSRRVAGALADVAAWEQVKRFVLLPRAFSVAAEELTVSLKLRRGVIFQKYRAELDALYRTQP